MSASTERAARAQRRQLKNFTWWQLVEAVDEGDPVPLCDQALINIAVAATSELKQRLPLYAIRNGDLPDECWTVAKNREKLAQYVKALANTNALHD